MRRVAIFIDGGYLDKVLKQEFNEVRIDYQKLSRYIADLIHPDTDILRSYYYHCLPYQSQQPSNYEKELFGEKDKLFSELRKLRRFEVRLGHLQRYEGKHGHFEFRQKMVDTLLSIDLVRLSANRQITHAAIIAGDADFVPAIEVACNEGVGVWLFHGNRYHQKLWYMVDERIQLTEDTVEKLRLLAL